MPTRFRTQYYGKRPVHISRHSAGDPAASSAGSGSTEVLGITPYWNEDTLKVYFKSRAALRENYCDTDRPAPGMKAPADPCEGQGPAGARCEPDRQSRPSRLSGSCGCTLTCSNASSPRAWRRTSIAPFRACRRSRPIYDLHDVFAVQAEGEKTWRVYEARADTPVAPLPPGDEIEKWLTASRGRAAVRSRDEAGRYPLPATRAVPRCADRRTGFAHVRFGVSPATGPARCSSCSRLS